MGKVILIVIGIICSLNSPAQKKEIRVTLYSGFASFKGEAATGNTNMTGYSPTSDMCFPGNVFGTKPGFSAGAELKLSFLTKSGMLINLQSGYESLSTSQKINYINPSALSSSIAYVPATGKSRSVHQFISIFPSLGYRIKAGPLKVDLSAGLVIAPCIAAREKSSATATSGNRTLTSDTKIDHPGNDIRPSLETLVQYKKLGLTLGYQFGSRNFNPLLIGSNTQLEAKMRFLKVGISYRLF